jgi:hypothetical protein
LSRISGLTRAVSRRCPSSTATSMDTAMVSYDPAY